MRLFIALLLVAVALPAAALNTTYIVQPYHPNAKNVPVANGGGTADTPWISPSYAVAQITGNNDTILIYPGNPGSDSAYYNDYIDYSGETISFVGVSVWCDSPTFTRNGPIFFYYVSGNKGNIANTRISGFRFYNCRTTNRVINLFAETLDGFTFDQNIADSITATGDLYSNGVIGVCKYYNTDTADSVTIANNVFYGLRNTSAIYVNNNANSCTIGLYVYNNTFRDVVAPICFYWNSNNTEQVVLDMCDCIIDSANEQFYIYSAGSKGIMYHSTRYTDIYNVKTDSYIFMTPAFMQIAYSNNYNVNPQWKSNDRYCYLADTSPLLTTPYSSSTGGLIGVLWGGTFTPYIAPMVGGAPPATRFMQFLLRGRYR